MKIDIDRRALVDDLATAVGVTARKTTIPILSHALLEVKGSALRIVTTDLDHTVVTDCEGKDVALVGRGTMVVPAGKLLEIGRALSGDTVSIEDGATNGTVSVSCGKSRFSLHCRPATDYPTVPILDDKAKSVKLPVAAMRRLIAGTLYAVSEDESRFQVTGALFTFNADSVEAVATDGHRLALVERVIPDMERGLFGESFLVHRRALQLVARLTTSEIELIQGGHHIGFRAGHRLLITRRLEGNFPDYKRVIARHNEKRPVFDREELLAAVQRVRLMTGDRARAIRIDLAPDLAKLVAANSDLGEAEEELACAYDGGICRIGANPDYLVDALSSLHTKQVRIEMKDSNTQMVLHPDGADVPVEDRQALCVVMPMKV